MYNGIGLQTPKGSGTSGYVQRNLSYVKPAKSRQEFDKKFRELKENPIQPMRKPNKEILEHEMLHRIEAELYDLENILKDQKVPEEEIRIQISKKRDELLFESKNKTEAMNLKETHSAALVQEKHIQKIKAAFNISDQYKLGSAFDLESQNKTRLDKINNFAEIKEIEIPKSIENKEAENTLKRNEENEAKEIILSKERIAHSKLVQEEKEQNKSKVSPINKYSKNDEKRKKEEKRKHHNNPSKSKSRSKSDEKRIISEKEIFRRKEGKKKRSRSRSKNKTKDRYHSDSESNEKGSRSRSRSRSRSKTHKHKSHH